MGARTDFLRAMVFGVVIGVAITTAYFQLRRGRSSTSSSSSANGVAGSASVMTPGAGSSVQLSRAQELQQLRARIAELEQAGSAASGAFDPDRGMSTSDDWWAKLPPNPAWDEPREKQVIERIAKLGVKLDPKQVECKRRCCRLALDDDTYDERWDEIDSSVGLGFEPSDGTGVAKAGSVFVVTKCWSTEPLAKPIPDRAAERDALLARAKPELDKCAQTTSPAITLELGLHVDEAGQIAKVDSNAKQLGQKAATCAEGAILQAASFATAPTQTYVPLTVPLGK